MRPIAISPQPLQLSLHSGHALSLGGIRRPLSLCAPGGKLMHNPRKRLLRHTQLPSLAAQHLHCLRIPHPLRQPLRGSGQKLRARKLLIHPKSLPPCRHCRLISQIIPHPGTRSGRGCAAISFSSSSITTSSPISTSTISGTSHQAHRASAICAPITSLLAQKTIRNQMTNKHNILTSNLNT